MNRPLFLLLLLPFAARAQKCPEWSRERNPALERPYGVQLYLGGPTGWASVDLSGPLQDLIPAAPAAIRLHGGLGLVGFDLGAAYELRGRHFRPYLGLDLACNADELSVEPGLLHFAVLVPSGCRYQVGNGISLAAEVAPYARSGSGALTDNVGLWGALKIGYFFRHP